MGIERPLLATHVADNLAYALVEFMGNFSKMVAHWKGWRLVDGWNG